MTYVAPQLTLIGQASGVVLGEIPHNTKRDSPVSALNFYDSALSLEAEW